VSPRSTDDPCIASNRGFRLISAGFGSGFGRLTTHCGWGDDESISWGYCGDDGRARCGNGHGDAYAEPFGAGDTIGCGVLLHRRQIYFTKNGKFLGKLQPPAFG
jgi:hypothetical protein